MASTVANKYTCTKTAINVIVMKIIMILRTTRAK